MTSCVALPTEFLAESLTLEDIQRTAMVITLSVTELQHNTGTSSLRKLYVTASCLVCSNWVFLPCQAYF